MRKDTALLLLGFLVFVSPLLGIPRSWKDPAFFVLGALIVLIGLSYRFAARRRERHAHAVAHEESNPNDTSADVPQSAF